MRYRSYIAQAIIALTLKVESASAKTVEPLYEEPFDLGGGGAVLTRATQEAMLMSNPAQLPYGGKAYRWLGLKVGVKAGQSSLALARSMAQGGEGQGEDTSEQVTALFSNPLHIGASQAVSFIANNGGIMVFGDVEPDVRAWRSGDPTEGAGVPQVVARNDTALGVLASVADRSPWRWLSFGMSMKYLALNSAVGRVNLIDRDSVEEAASIASAIFSPSQLNTGLGTDLSSLIFFQGPTMDIRLAGTVTNAGGMRLQGGNDVKILKQTGNVGLGITFHGMDDALHFCIDARDITDEYREPDFKRVYTGIKLLLRTYIGLSAGIYHGSPTYGVAIDTVVARIAGAVYSREYGQSPGVDQRRIYVLSLATGYPF